ncbi:MAG: hypothetical protein CM15mP104_4060 [Gammaproteobacteria bacterium]|nr:MAG: hypothetical protein CM15mP104_4060 [Gammaproteobacteria bacterium]
MQINYANNSRPRYIKAIDSLGINLVFDIGANSGQFASSVLEHGFKGKIISFEPTSSDISCYARILIVFKTG